MGGPVEWDAGYPLSRPMTTKYACALNMCKAKCERIWTFQPPLTNMEA